MITEGSKWLGLLFWMAVLLGGCGPQYRYVFTPPPSYEGNICINECMNSQQQCVTLTQSSYYQCLNNRNYAMQNYNQCRQNADDKQDRNRCWMPPGCYAPSTYYCEENFRGCYQACGGRVDAYLVKE